MEPRTLLTTYSSATSAQTFSEQLPPLSQSGSEQNVADKTAYLAALRAGVTRMQADVNAYLTERMKSDKLEAAGAGGKGEGKRREEKAEEMYGEEGGEEDG